jgi:hypothetical protein
MILGNGLHKGVILNVSSNGFDAAAATFASVFYEPAESDYLCLFYTGARDVDWSNVSIGLAVSEDGLSFRKRSDLNPVIDSMSLHFKETATPVVFRIKNNFYIVFAARPFGEGRRICIAYADDIEGPYHFIGELIRPEASWEGNDIDLGPFVAKLNENEALIYYSNVSNKWSWNLVFGPRYWHRRIGILKLRINSPKDIEVSRFEGNPLKHLNGPKGSWNESLFCPGYMKLEGVHYLLPATSTYSIGFPYRQYIGLIADTTPYFQHPLYGRILVNGPNEKKLIIPQVKSELALDASCPIVIGDKLYLYYSVMDRADGVWKEALTIFPLDNRHISE